MFYSNWSGRLPPGVEGGVQGAAATGLNMFVSGKFYPLFALLMGVGMAIQVERAAARGLSVVPVYLRRLFFLYLIGWIGSFFLSVSQLYFLAVAALVTFFICYPLRRHRVLLLTVILWISLGDTIPFAIRSFQREPYPLATAEEIAERRERRLDLYEEARTEDRSLHSPFYPADEIRSRFEREIGRGFPSEFRNLENLVSWDVELVLFMMVGFFLWQLGWLKKAWEYRRKFTYLLIIAGCVGLGSTIVSQWISSFYGAFIYGELDLRTPIQKAFQAFFYTLEPMGLDLAYIAGLALLMSSPWPTRLLTKFAPAGRMAFTNYVLQWALPPILFPLLFGWWMPEIGPIQRMIKVTVVFLLLAAGSTFWMQRYRFGPFEWLWRSLTYWKLQPMRLERASPAD
jgi:uncharacterized protein